MTKVLAVKIHTSGVDSDKGKKWANEFAKRHNIKITDVDVVENKISFTAMEDPWRSLAKIGEHLTTNEAFEVKEISAEPTTIGPSGNGPVKRDLNVSQ